MLAKVRGWQCQWPVAVWSMKLCLRKDMEQVLDSHKPGQLYLYDNPSRALSWTIDCHSCGPCMISSSRQHVMPS